MTGRSAGRDDKLAILQAGLVATAYAAYTVHDEADRPSVHALFDDQMTRS